MLFTSNIFLYAFLPVVLGLYLLLGRFSKATWPVIHLLILASFIFYGYQNISNVFLLASSIMVNFGVSRVIQSGRGRSGLSLFAGVVFNLALLGYFKYTNFFLGTIGDVTGQGFSTLNIALPLAISFYTFQQIAFLADAYAGKLKDVSFRDYLLFVTFFPQLIIGPIVHHSEMMPQFARSDLGRIKWSDFTTGACYLFSGLVKKVFIADTVGAYVDTVHLANASGDPVGFATAWLAALCFSMQIYFDFSGYTDMAVGLAKLFGIDLPINFNSPYKSRNVADFWRRWHITLSRWLRDYLYIPLGGSRVSLPRGVVNALIVFFLGGLWHGAAWTFVLWGLMHGLGVSAAHVMEKAKLSLPRIAGVVVTFLFVTVSWVLFRAETTGEALNLYVSMFSLSGEGADIAGTTYLYGVLVVSSLFVFFVPNTHAVIPRVEAVLLKLPRIALLAVIVMVWLLFAAFDLDSSAEFIYFDF